VKFYRVLIIEWNARFGSQMRSTACGIEVALRVTAKAMHRDASVMRRSDLSGASSTIVARVKKWRKLALFRGQKSAIFRLWGPTL
jgi:hypothetical protein